MLAYQLSLRRFAPPGEPLCPGIPAPPSVVPSRPTRACRVPFRVRCRPRDDIPWSSNSEWRKRTQHLLWIQRMLRRTNPNPQRAKPGRFSQPNDSPEGTDPGVRIQDRGNEPNICFRFNKWSRKRSQVRAPQGPSSGTNCRPQGVIRSRPDFGANGSRKCTAMLWEATIRT